MRSMTAAIFVTAIALASAPSARAAPMGDSSLANAAGGHPWLQVARCACPVIRGCKWVACGAHFRLTSKTRCGYRCVGQTGLVWK